MNYFSFLIFLVLLSSLDFMLLVLLDILGLASAPSRQKIMILKIGLTMIFFAPFIFIVLRMLSWHTLDIILPGKFINQLPDPNAIYSEPPPHIHWSFYIFSAYITGLFVMVTRILLSYLSARKQLSKSLPAYIQGYPIFLNENIQSPLGFGLPSAKIYFPKDAEIKWTSREIQMSLAHEQIHLKQNDSLWKLLSLIVQAVLFFVPWSYLLHRRFELEMEICCDEKTCAETGANFKEYGSLLLAMTCTQPQNLTFTNITDSTIKIRILAMQSQTIKRPFLVSMLSAIILLVASTAIATTSGITEKNSVFDITSKIIIDGKLVSSPRIVAHANQIASIGIFNKGGIEGIEMEVIARDVAMSKIKDAIEINFDINYRNVEENMHSRPKFILAPNQEGVIRISSDTGHLYEIHVVASRYS